MTLYERYLNGETKSVYDDIHLLGNSAFTPAIFEDVENVLIETFKRVAYNLKVIFDELVLLDYPFKTHFTYNFERPLIDPLRNVDDMLFQLETTFKPYGSIPIALKMFYKIVGACNFVADDASEKPAPWHYADPIQILSLDNVVEEMTSEEHIEYLRQLYNDEGCVCIQLSADYLHKDNVSGGPAYAVPVTQQPAIDPLFLNEHHNTT